MYMLPVAVARFEALQYDMHFFVDDVTFSYNGPYTGLPYLQQWPQRHYSIVLRLAPLLHGIDCMLS